MTQLHCYVPNDIAEKVQLRAAEAGLSMSRYLAELVKRDADVNTGWPEGYFDIFGKWEGELFERPPQLPMEQRLELE